jgi:hypothetical protein
MAVSEEPAVLRLPARDIPLPRSISPEAQAVISAPQLELTGYPALDDPGAWKAMVAGRDEMILSMVAGRLPTAGVDVRADQLGGFTLYRVTPPGADPADRRVYLDIHGGALIMGGGECCRATAIATALRTAR